MAFYTVFTIYIRKMVCTQNIRHTRERYGSLNPRVDVSLGRAHEKIRIPD